MVKIKRTKAELAAIQKRKIERRNQERRKKQGFTIGIGEEKPKEEVKKKVEEKKAPIVLEEPKVGRQKDDSILLNLPEKEKEITTGEKLKAFGTGAVIGAGLGFGAVALGAGGIAAGAALLFGKSSAVATASIVGKTTVQTTLSGGVVQAARFATNAKSAGLTSSFLVKAGLTLSAAGLAVGIIGSYPFAGFIKEEALQTLSFATKVAMDSGDLEGAQEAIDQINELLNPTAWEKMLAAIPFLNVHTQLKDFYLAATTKNANDQEALDKARRVQTGEEESDFAKSRRESDEAARERELGFRAEDEAFFEDIREEQDIRRREIQDEEDKRSEEEDAKFKRIAEERDIRDEEERVADETESARFEEIRERNKREDLEDLRFKAEYFDLIREGRFDEAAQLLAEQ